MSAMNVFDDLVVVSASMNPKKTKKKRKGAKERTTENSTAESSRRVESRDLDVESRPPGEEDSGDAVSGIALSNTSQRSQSDDRLELARLELRYCSEHVVLGVGRPFSMEPDISGCPGAVLRHAAGSMNFSIEPPLPPDIALDPTTGIIAGVARKATAPNAASFRVTVLGDGEIASVPLHIQFN